MEIFKDYDLSKLNTFGIHAKAKFFVEIKKEEELPELFEDPIFTENKRLFLGGGSNVLFTGDFGGIVVFNKLQGIEILEENSESVLVRAMGGEIWHDLVTFAVDHGYWGIENLSLIPGTVGAAPMQNIGAYGAELKSTLVNVEAFDIGTGKKRIFTGDECRLGYRDSIFKNEAKGKYFISAITLKLSKKGKPNLSYKILKEYLEQPARTTGVVQSGGNKIEVKGPTHISDAVADIRRSKLPDPKIIGNAGSFFKNIFADKKKLMELQANYPEIPHFEDEGSIKIPSGWLIEKCGWKGKKVGNVGVHDKQALVLVNHGGATGKEVLDLARHIIKDVEEKFGLELIPEVNIV